MAFDVVRRWATVGRPVTCTFSGVLTFTSGWLQMQFSVSVVVETTVSQVRRNRSFR